MVTMPPKLTIAQRQDVIRQAVEFSAALNAADTDAALHVFGGESL